MSIYKANRFGVCGALSMMVLLTGVALAQPPEGPPRGEGGRRPEGGPGGREGMRGDPKMMAEMMLKRFDKDGDKMLNVEELVVALTEMRQQFAPGGPGSGPGGNPAGVGRMLEQNDKDGDGKLTGDEIPEGMRQNMARIDTNNDSSIDRAELERMMRQQFAPGGPGSGPGGNPAGVGRMLEQNDKDGDGKLTGDEIPERMRQNMARIDTNDDSSIDRAELERMMSNFGGGNRPPRDGDGQQNDRPQRPAAE